MTDPSSISSARFWLGRRWARCSAASFPAKLGRRKTILLSAVNFIIGSILCALAPNEHVLIIARVILGLAVGIASFTAPLYLSEISPQSVRGSLISMYQLMITIGIVMAFLSNTWLAHLCHFRRCDRRPLAAHARYHRHPGGSHVCRVFFLPESPRWLFMQGFKDKAIAVF